MLAASQGHDFLLPPLLAAGASPTHRDPRSGCDAFYVACARGRLLCAAYLLGCGAAIDGQNAKGNTALHVAARMGQVEVVRWLVRMGADKGGGEDFEEEW
ncbi:hypothetical protein NEMBOFW57_004254 [Staphylotrichum longicolle]|uniref:Uncharacterized protein n=1 Tax=Staphylotrichum longicolle TaxID=669026 RepID=A0AAD4I098_9PEZI|nr:hypothetical protein NEMBOFW57_004254 [Staphylotrichum longicolle]